MLKKLLFCCFFLSLVSCSEDEEKAEEIAKIPVDFELSRFDRRFAEATPADLQALKKDFPYLFPREYPDSVWIAQMNDTVQLALDQAVREEFPELENMERGLKSLFQHIKFYFPQEEIPEEVVTLTSFVDYRNQVVWADSLVLISIDTYLGTENPLYLGVQEYLKKNFNRDQILPDVAKAFAETQVEVPRSRNFLDHMIYYGKILYLKDLLLPYTTEAEKMGYKPEELKWAEANEDQIWRYFVERELLYSSDTDLQTRFLYPAPFSKFYLQLDSEAPDRLGQFIGWQIVKQFMEKNDVTVQGMLNSSAETIFEESNYKPQK